jgi:predicted dithiol-disulfide oxidoreductase (DUF899 family)
MTDHEVTNPTAWLARRKDLLAKEKALTHARDELAAARRALPWVPVEKRYVFDGPSGEESLAELFGPRSQLIMYHFMFAPTAEVGCKSCSFWADNWSASVAHLQARDVTLLAVSRAPLERLEAFKRRMGWSFKWVSSGRSDFNYDLAVSFREEERERGGLTYNYAPLDPRFGPDMPGFSVFHKDPDGAVFHTYSTFGRGIEVANATYQLLDLTPKGRDEQSLARNMSWVRFHDEYPQGA